MSGLLCFFLLACGCVFYFMVELVYPISKYECDGSIFMPCQCRHGNMAVTKALFLFYVLAVGMLLSHILNRKKNHDWMLWIAKQ